MSRHTNKLPIGYSSCNSAIKIQNQNQALAASVGDPSPELHVPTEIVPLLAPVYEVYFRVPGSARIDVPRTSPYNEKIQSFGRIQPSAARTESDH